MWKVACKLEEREPGQIQKGKGKYTTWENNKSTYLRQIWLIWNKIGDSQLGKTLKKIKNKLKSCFSVGNEEVLKVLQQSIGIKKFWGKWIAYKVTRRKLGVASSDSLKGS